ncbi:MFS transporter [Enterovibrio norvegicus FF-33]|uniref:MFS transporter n=1 Tax=Enterovibrio norvegicus FF-454 TaxID=1185651 RepID=A0A1E5BY85_9GAMM|nr:LysE family transporter [Enterovibrio norvegicus]OEE58218.1 MFS transporter [Enterovibrio norvegicus FF-454]OEE67239.1 MFS transporter [Enterovibrio norvegicus FF-33]OEE80061.1 MFS transporter [Enterovibrio norvegicus FF-162]
MEFYHAFITLTLVHLLGAASPGPDFVMVSQQSLVHGRRAGLLVSLGIALGLSVHIIYSSIGLATVISDSAIVLSVMKYLAAAYLIYLGVKGIRSKAAVGDDEQSVPVKARSTAKLISMGFVCNALNPKAPLYFLSVFTLVVSPDMPTFELFLLGIWMMFVQLAWFSSVALVLSKPSVQAKFKRVGHWVDRVLGSVMLAFGLKLLFTSSSK